MQTWCGNCNQYVNVMVRVFMFYCDWVGKYRLDTKAAKQTALLSINTQMSYLQKLYTKDRMTARPFFV